MREVDPESFALISGIDWSDEENPEPNPAVVTNKPNVNTIAKPVTHKPAQAVPKSNHFRK